MTKIAISSSSFYEKNLTDLCEYVSEQQIDCLELSGGLILPQGFDLKSYFVKYLKAIKFYVHNYFPPPGNPFVLNLAHPETVEKSYLHCVEAVNFCSSLGIPFYSIHVGMAFNPLPEHLGKPQANLSAINFKDSRELLISSCYKLINYAQSKAVGILLENNVIASFNLVDGANNRYHLAEPVEDKTLFSLFDHPGAGLLLDVGHLKVTSNVMNFAPLKFIKQFKSKIRAVHLNDNNGEEDQNMPVSEDSWFWPHIPWSQLEYVSLEISPEPISFLKKQIKLVKKKLKEYSA